jgi:hypothetical protein
VGGGVNVKITVLSGEMPCSVVKTERISTMFLQKVRWWIEAGHGLTFQSLLVT